MPMRSTKKRIFSKKKLEKNFLLCSKNLLDAEAGGGFNLLLNFEQKYPCVLIKLLKWKN